MSEREEYPFGFSLEQMDVPAFFNMRDWLEKAVREAGADVTGKGVGMGEADLDIVLEGMKYNVRIKPLPT